MSFWSRQKNVRAAVASAADQWHGTLPLYRWSKKDVFTLNDAFAGVAIWGATGAGKSSGSGKQLALSFLKNQFGILVLCMKKGEAAVWESYCRQAGRSKDFLRFSADGPWRFDPIAYELSRPDATGHTECIIGLLSSLLEIADRNTGGGGGGQDDQGFWRRSLRQLLRNLIDLIVIATGRVNIPDLYRLVVSAPTSREQLNDENWRKESFLFRCLRDADQRPKTPQQRHDFSLVTEYFLQEFCTLSDKTRSIIVTTFTSMIDVLHRGKLHQLFCTETNITPQAVEQGRIVVIDLSVQEHADVGLFSAMIWKHCFQKNIERRNLAQSPRPVALWADEAQVFLSSNDHLFAQTCRASRVANVMLSQNLSNYYGMGPGGEKGKALADSLLGNFNTHIFHANGDSVTNLWAAEKIGRSRQFLVNASNSHDDRTLFDGMTGRSQATGGVSEIFEYTVQPAAFPKLRTGGPANGHLVDSIIFSNGSCFHATGQPYLRCTFSQK